MYEIDISRLVRVLEALEDSRLLPPTDSNGFVRKRHLKVIEDHLRDLCQFQDALGFDAGVKQQIYYLQDKIDYDMGDTPADVVTSLIGSLHETIVDALTSRKFLYIPIDEARYYQTGELFGRELLNEFPEAEYDMIEAGSAYATGLNTSSVFHSMRVAEFALRRIARALNVKLKENKKPKPIEFGTWEQILIAIENKRNALRAQPKSKKQNARLVHYSGCADTISYLKDHYRNEVMHTRQRYNEHNALDAARRVRALLQAVSTAPK